MTIKRMKRHAFVAFVAAGFAGTALATATTISEPTELAAEQTDSSNWCLLTVNSELSIVAGGKLFVPKGGKIYLPGGTGYDATIRTVETGVFNFYWPQIVNKNTLYIGSSGGRGHVVCAGTGANMLNYLEVGANAEADASVRRTRSRRVCSRRVRPSPRSTVRRARSRAGRFM